ncbi:uncharacterized protein LOC123306371 [Coccinella septempunctata]|uniref:uncharacterized protein LOC123306371 n=1 Tax=Coccinella septempunctata TaxID=41139 RepID=UPI001D083151|nr:uncharacterized protein LOC123306371 [Coccinella septempunctata]
MDAVRSEIDDEALLQCISNFKPLYDKKDKGYKSNLQKENCWISICNTLGCTVMEAKARFKSLREKYRREVLIKEKLERSGAPSNSRPVWPLMSFFHSLYKCSEEATKETISNIPVEHLEVSDAEEEHIYVQFAEDAGSSTPSCSSTFRSTIPKRRKDRSDASSTDSQ